jgi:excisionase family DNA binding protein
MSSLKEPPILLTVKEVSILLRVQRPKVYDLIKDGALDGFKVGADWRVRRDSVERLIGAIPEDFFQKEHGDDEATEAPRMEASKPRPSVMS